MQEVNKLNELIKNKNYSALKIYVNLGFDLSLTDLNNDNAFKFGNPTSKLFNYVIENDLDSIKKNFNKNKSDWINDNGYSILQWAIILSKNNIAKFLIENNFPIINENVYKENDFLLAARFKNFEILDFIIEKQYNNNLIFCENKNGFNALHFTCSHKNIKSINKLLVIAREDNIVKQNIFGANCLHWLVHGQNHTDELKHENLINFLASISTYQSNNKAIISKLLNNKNALGLTPINWLEIYNQNISYKFIKDLL